MKILKKVGSRIQLNIDGIIYTYDFNGNKYYSEHGREIKLSTMKHKLRNISLYDFDKDMSHAGYLSLLKNIAFWKKYTRTPSIGTVLASLGNYPLEERLMLQGIDIRYPLSDLSNKTVTTEVLKFLTETKKTTERAISNWSFWIADRVFTNKNIYQFLKLMWERSKDEEILYGVYEALRYNFENIESLINDYRYDIKSLVNYVYAIHQSEGTRIRDIIGHLFDCNRMCLSMNKKFDKYPRFLLSTHSIIMKTYSSFTATYDEEKFTESVEKYAKYKYKYGEYAVVIPKTPQDLIDEGIELNHCVSSYIKPIMNGITQVMFIRDRKNLSKSLLTMEILDDKIVQVKGHMNRPPVEKELKFINRFAKKFNLHYN